MVSLPRFTSWLPRNPQYIQSLDFLPGEIGLDYYP